MLHAALFLLLSLFSPVAYAQSNTATIQAQIDQSNAQIAQLQAEIAQLQTELSATSEKKQTLQNAVSALNLNIQKITKSITLTNAQIVQKDKEIQRLTGDISTTAGNIAETQEQIKDALRQLTILDSEPFGLILLQGGTLSDFFNKAIALTSLRTSLEQKVTDLAELKTNLSTSKTAAQQKRDQLAALQRQLGQQKQSLSIARQSQSDLLIQTKNKESVYQDLIAEKKAQEAQFEAEIFRLSQQLQSADSTKIPTAAHRILFWPLDNIRITQLFGKTVDSTRLYTSGTHNGVDFAASIGTPVHTVLGGNVLAVNYITAAQDKKIGYCQYGSWVLIKHDNGLATLYTHLSKLSVSKGDQVTTGELIGYSGDTGYAIGPHLHMSLYNASSITFQNYTCNSGYKVYIPIAPVNGYLDPMAYFPLL